MMRKFTPVLGFILLFIAVDAWATHFRYSHISWRPTGVTNEVVYTVSGSFRRGAPGTFAFGYAGSASDGGLAVGDTFQEYIGATRLSFGDGGQTPVLIFKVDAIDPVQDWVIAHAINPSTGGEWRHIYAGTGPYSAKINSCCRTSVEVNNPGRSYQIATTVDLGLVNASPISAISPIVACPKGQCIFQIPAADVNFDTVTFRLSTAAEAGGGFVQPGQFSASPLSVSTTGLVTWDSSTFVEGFYSTSIVLEESRAGNPSHGSVMLDFLINTREFLGQAPVIDVPPTLENGENVDVNANSGETLTTTVQCSDPDVGDIVTLGHLGLPNGAVMSPAIAIGNPAVATITWAPVLTQVAAISLSCSDTKGNSALPHGFTVNIQGAVIPPGPDRDNDLFCDNMTITQLIASGLYNVIDNDLKPSAILIGTAARDLIIAGGLGDIMYGLGADDCIIGSVSADYASGGDGNDQMFGWSGDDVMEGDAGDDYLMGRDNNDTLLGGPGNDTLHGWDDEDYMFGGDGNDTFFGGNDIDRIDGGAGDDQMFAESGEDVMVGGPGNDGFDGGPGSDVCVLDAEDLVAPINCVVFPVVSTAPVLQTSIGDISLDEFSTLTVNIVADDADPPGGEEPIPGSGLSFIALHLPPFVILTDNGDRTATLSFTPQPGDAGSYPGIIIRVEDDGEPVLADVEVFDLSITGGNDAPALVLIGNQTMVEAESVAVSIIATDPNVTNTLSFAANGLPAFASLIDNGNGTAVLNLSPAVGDAGQYHGITVSVFDNGVPIKFDQEIFSVIVNAPVNLPPTLTTAVGNVTLEEGQNQIVPLVATDPDTGQTLSWSVQGVASFVSVVDLGGGNAELHVAPIHGDAGVYQGNVVTVVDNGTPVQSDSATFMVTVTTFVTDTDLDTVVDLIDNCINTPNPLQTDTDADGMGDACDADDDNDGLTDIYEGTIGTNPLLLDTDGDGFNDGLEDSNASDPLSTASTPANGDINENGMLDAGDVFLAQRFVLGLAIPTAQQLLRCDVFPVVAGVPVPDGQLSISDLLLIQRRALNL